MPVIYSGAVLNGPYFFRPTQCLSDSDLVRVELFAGDYLPATVAFLRVVGFQDPATERGDFFGFVSKTRDGLLGRVGTLSSRLCNQLVVGRLCKNRRRSWLAPAPWNYSPLNL